jgi:hypothetical protein
LQTTTGSSIVLARNLFSVITCWLNVCMNLASRDHKDIFSSSC